MRAALYQLGFHDVYHMASLHSNTVVDGPYWERAFEARYGDGTFTRDDWDELLNHYQAVCDLPASIFGCELAEAYPEAKVVILNRDPERWYQSVLTSIYTVIKPPTAFWAKLRMKYRAALDPQAKAMAPVSRNIGMRALRYDHGKEKEKALAWYKRTYDEYRERIPAERRIEFTVKDGWKPLCEHLGVPIPMIRDEKTGEMVEAPFPHLNDNDSFHSTIKEMQANGIKRANEVLLIKIGKLAVTSAVTGVAGLGLYFVWKTRLGGRL